MSVFHDGSGNPIDEPKMTPEEMIDDHRLGTGWRERSSEELVRHIDDDEPIFQEVTDPDTLAKAAVIMEEAKAAGMAPRRPRKPWRPSERRSH